MKRLTIALAAAFICSTASGMATAADTTQAPAQPAAAPTPAPEPGDTWLAERGDPIKAQPIVTSVCAACHGANGNSVVPTYPNLAGQGYSYLLKQLNDFKSGKRQNPIMNGMVASLSEDDMHNLAAYFSEQTVTPAAAQNKELANAGQKLWRAGVASQGVPACESCHGPQGLGVPVEFPRLAGQHSQYVYAQLNNFRTGARSNDPAKMMRTIAARLSDQDMQELAQYVRGLH